MGEDTVKNLDSVIEGLKGSYPVDKSADTHRTGMPVLLYYENGCAGVYEKILEAHAKAHGFVVRYVKKGEPHKDVYFCGEGIRIEETKTGLQVNWKPRKMSPEEQDLFYGLIQKKSRQ